MRRRRVPGETSAADDVVVVVDVVEAVDSDASDRAEEGGSLICARTLRSASEMDAARVLRAAPLIYALHAPRARVPRR